MFPKYFTYFWCNNFTINFEKIKKDNTKLKTYFFVPAPFWCLVHLRVTAFLIE